MKKFFRMNAPYHDFAIVQFKKIKNFNFDEMMCRQVGVRTYVLSFSDIVKNDALSGVSYGLSGYVADKDMFLYGETSERLSVDLPKTGKYSYFECGFNDEIISSTDYFGQSVIYYTEMPEFILISNRIHLLSILTRRLGGHLSLDKNVLARKLFYNIYNENSYQNQYCDTLVSEIKKVPVGKKIIVTEAKIEIKDEPLFSRLLGEGDSLSYEKYLENGVEELRGVINKISQSPDIREMIIPLSGGKDSRLMLAALIGSKANKDKIYARTYKTKSVLDDKIAIKMQRDLGIRSRSVKSFYGYKTSFSVEEMISIYTSFFGGNYTLFNAGGESALGANHSTINLVGTSSNVLRAGAADTLSKHFDNLHEMNIEDFCVDFTNKFGLSNVFGDEVKALALSDLKSFYRTIPGVSLIEKLEYSHMNAGSRFHGGQASIFHSWNESPFLNIMLTPSLYMAAKSLPIKSRMEGHLFYDFVLHAYPALACYNYDKPFPYADFRAEELGIERINVSKSYDTSDYFAKKETVSQMFLPSISKKFGNKSILDYLESTSDAVLEKVFLSVPGSVFLNNKKFKNYLKESFRKDGEYAKRAILTLMAVHLLLAG